MTVQSKTFLDDGQYQIQDGCHRSGPMGWSIELQCTPEKMDGSNIPPRLGVVLLTNSFICNSDGSWQFIISTEYRHLRNGSSSACTLLPFWPSLLQRHKPVQAKSCDLQPHFCDEQFPLQWQTAISLIAVGAGNSSVGCGFRIPSSSLVNPFCSGSMTMSDACLTTLAFTCSLCACCFRAPIVDGSLSLSAMCLLSLRINESKFLGILTEQVCLEDTRKCGQ